MRVRNSQQASRSAAQGFHDEHQRLHEQRSHHMGGRDQEDHADKHHDPHLFGTLEGENRPRGNESDQPDDPSGLQRVIEKHQRHCGQLVPASHHVFEDPADLRGNMLRALTGKHIGGVQVLLVGCLNEDSFFSVSTGKHCFERRHRIIPEQIPQ